ncbi:hypothetical protein H5410_021422 [Solanum commersonii]|uniref:Uncharacterized protein n=1 Tax=Solanum commersonii TaxID=4109 RepID=A0A9J5ZCK2_SOLCO|nr:hypothetical protein H5410_021422 [Solanum commersonii]
MFILSQYLMKTLKFQGFTPPFVPVSEALKKKDQNAMKGEVSASPNISANQYLPPNGPEREDAEGKNEMAMKQKKGESSSHSAT